MLQLHSALCYVASLCYTVIKLQCVNTTNTCGVQVHITFKCIRVSTSSETINWIKHVQDEHTAHMRLNDHTRTEVIPQTNY